MRNGTVHYASLVPCLIAGGYKEDVLSMSCSLFPRGHGMDVLFSTGVTGNGCHESRVVTTGFQCQRMQMMIMKAQWLWLKIINPQNGWFSY